MELPLRGVMEPGIKIVEKTHHSLCYRLAILCLFSRVQVIDVESQTIRCSIPKPKTRHLQFSPCGTYLALWEPYAGICNVMLYIGGSKTNSF